MGKRFQVHVDGLAYGGRGLGRVGGKVVFVPFVLPGEVAECRLVREKARWCEAELLEILEPSPLRKAPFCSCFKDCGGCHYQHIPYENQLGFKEEIFSSILSRQTGIDSSLVSPIVPSVREISWRARARLVPGQQQAGASSSWGFFKAGSHDVVPLSSCPVLVQPADEILKLLNQLTSRGFPASEMFKNCIIETGLDDSGRAVLFPKGTGRSKLERIQKFLDLAGFSAVLGGRHGRRAVKISSPVCFYRGPGAEKGLFSPAGSFYQANLFQNHILVRQVVDYCRQAGGENIIEFFSGSGNFSIPLASRGFHVTAVESDRQAVEAAKKNLERNPGERSQSLEIIHSDAERYLQGMGEGRNFDTAVIDPPRIGAAGLCRLLCKSSLKSIVYVSCDPMTLARDINILASGGFRLSKTRPIDMFPQTYHIESVSLLDR